jgi:type IV pilus assembly protein PilV
MQGARAAGFTLVEVMVAIVILSIGMLGLATLQMTGLKNNQTAQLRSIATLQAYNMADRMRANMGAVKAGDYDNPTSTSTNANCENTTGCSPSAMAAHDFAEWNNNNATLLPGGSGTVCIDSDPDPSTTACDGSGSLYVVTVNWVERNHDDPNDLDGTKPQHFSLSFEP